MAIAAMAMAEVGYAPSAMASDVPCRAYPRRNGTGGPSVTDDLTNSEQPAPRVDPDHAVVVRAVAGDIRAFELLVRKYQPRVLRLIGRWVRDAARCEDVAQDVFLSAYRALPNFRGDAQFYTWLYRIAANAAKKAAMRQSRDPVRYLSDLQPDHVDGEISEDRWEPSHHDPSQTHEGGPEAEVASREIAAAVNEAVDALPPELAEAITLREIEGMSYEDIAMAMDCPIGTVRSRIFRAREAISKRIKPMLNRQGGKRW